MRTVPLLILLVTLAAGCDVLRTVRFPELNTARSSPGTGPVYGFWDVVSTGAEDYTSVTATELVFYERTTSCFTKSTLRVTSTSGAVLRAVGAQGDVWTATIDPADENKMTTALADFRFFHERATGDDLTLAEVEGLLCDD